MKSLRSSPSQACASGVSSTSTRFQPISFTGLAPTLPPSERDSNCPPRQCPITGTSCATASRMSASTGKVHGRSSFALIGPPMNPSPEKASPDSGTRSPSSSFTSPQGTRFASRNVAKCPGPSVREKRKTATGFTATLYAISPLADDGRGTCGGSRGGGRRERDRPLSRQGGGGDQPRLPPNDLGWATHARR